MRYAVVAKVVFISITLIPAPALAQVQGPRENTVAIGADVGFLASDNGESGDTLVLQAAAGSADAFVEYYYTARTSLRLMYGWSSPEFQSSPQSLRRQHVTFNVIYNWPIGRLRLLATLGGGAYFLDVREGGQTVGRGVTKPGGNVGAGAEYDFRTFAIRSEMTVHILDQEKGLPALDGRTLSAFTWMFGLKFSFK